MRPFAYVDGQGNYELKTYRDGDGAPPGRYRVSILIASAQGRNSRKDKPAGEEENPSGPVVSIPPDIIQKYGNVETAGIEVTIQDGENNLPPFELKPGNGA